MPQRMKEKVTVNGETRWLQGYSNQDLHESYVRLLEKEGLIRHIDPDESIPLFGDYMTTFYSTFKQRQEKNTVVNRNRIIKNHITPVWAKKRIDLIRTTDIQKWFNELGKTYSEETVLKIKNIMSPVLDAAVEDEIITKNPMASKRLEITGRKTVHHKAIPKDKMDRIKAGLSTMNWREKAMGGLLCYTGMRFEEVLGLRWEDISDEYIEVQRAVVHPTRNKPVVKAPKTRTSIRQIPLHEDLKALLGDKYKHGYILPTDKDPKRETPLSYTEARRAFDKIRKQFDIPKYTAHDFRDTCATEWRENGMSLDVIARLLGHSKTETTERRYVKYRTKIMDDARKQM